MTSNEPRTMRYENALYFANDSWHRENDPPSSRTTSFGATIMCRRLHRGCTFGELLGRRFVGILVAGVGWPAEQDLIVLGAGVGENLKNPREHARLWAIAAESLVEERELLWAHCRRATPIGPRRLVLFIIVGWCKVDDGMDETQDEVFGGPADYDINGHIVVVHGDLVAIAPL